MIKQKFVVTVNSYSGIRPDTLQNALLWAMMQYGYLSLVGMENFDINEIVKVEEENTEDE